MANRENIKQLKQQINNIVNNNKDTNHVVSGIIVEEAYGELNKATKTNEFRERIDVLRKKIHETKEIKPWPSTKKRDDIFRIDANEFTIEKAIEGFVRDGCIIVENIVSEDTCDRFINEMKVYVDNQNPINEGFSGKNTKRSGSLIARSPASWEMAAHPICTAINEAILGQQVLDHSKKFYNNNNDRVISTAPAGQMKGMPWQLHLTQVIAIGDSEPAQQIHRDNGFSIYVFDDVAIEVSSMWAIGTDFTKANGATRAIPGSYTWPRNRKPTKDDQIEQAVMKRGSALFYLGRTWHSGGNNTTGKTRYGVNFDWSLAFLRQEENQYIACPPSIAKDLPKFMSDQIGYRIGGYALVSKIC